MPASTPTLKITPFDDVDVFADVGFDCAFAPKAKPAKAATNAVNLNEFFMMLCFL